MTTTTASSSQGAVRIAVVDYGAGNLVSIGHALERVGAGVTLARRPAELAGCAGIVVPGVGASGPAMSRLRRMGMVEALSEQVVDGAVPYLGICLGMQLLFGRSDEDGARGLGWLEGPVRALPDAPRLPHIGWNQVDAAPAGLFAGVGSGSAFYFVHTYAPVPRDDRIVAGTTEHGGRFVSAVAAGNVFGVQFHPEKSGAAGLGVLANFVARAAAISGGAGGSAGRNAGAAGGVTRNAGAAGGVTRNAGAAAETGRDTCASDGTRRNAGASDATRRDAGALDATSRNAGASGSAR